MDISCLSSDQKTAHKMMKFLQGIPPVILEMSEEEKEMEFTHKKSSTYPSFQSRRQTAKAIIEKREQGY